MVPKASSKGKGMILKRVLTAAELEWLVCENH